MEIALQFNLSFSHPSTLVEGSIDPDVKENPIHGLTFNKSSFRLIDGMASGLEILDPLELFYKTKPPYTGNSRSSFKIHL